MAAPMPRPDSSSTHQGVNLGLARKAYQGPGGSTAGGSVGGGCAQGPTQRLRDLCGAQALPESKLKLTASYNEALEQEILFVLSSVADSELEHARSGTITHTLSPLESPAAVIQCFRPRS